MNITLTINEQVVSRIIEAVVKALAQPMPMPIVPVPNEPSAPQQVEALQKQVASLQKELAQAKAQPKPMAKPLQTAVAQALAKPQEVKPSEMQSQKPTNTAQSQAKPNGNGNGDGKGLYTSPDTLKAEQWAHKHVAEWLGQPCPFAKAQGRSWKELAEQLCCQGGT